ncbi:MAG: acyl-CoA dehydrogenase family protein [Burkholderiales bacterium]|nr:acyl-CoA dehydrogenase family protein [Burkholderiales bacterium]
MRPTAIDTPFFEPRHRDLAAALDAFAAREAAPHPHGSDVDAACRGWVRALGQAGFLAHCVPAAHGGVSASVESRALCVAREVLAWHDGLADFAFAMQGLGSGAITLAGSEAQRARWLPAVARGEAIAAFALSEPHAGSDAAALSTAAHREGGGWVLDGEKTWISNGGIADVYCVFARTGEAPGARGISAFVVPADTAGLVVAERIDVIAPHPLARLVFRDCRLPADALLGRAGEGFKLAMRTLDIFRASVAAAALGFARRALAASVERAHGRRMFGGTLGDLDLTVAALGDLATAIDAAALLTARAAWKRDNGDASTRTTREAAMAKLAATEVAQRAADRAVQLHGGDGVRAGSVPERLYREVRALRIYEGATEVQRLIVGRQTLAAAVPPTGDPA